MRTTLNLDDRLMAELRRRAAETDRTMTEIIEEALREAFSRLAEPGEPRDFQWVTVHGRVRPGVDVADRDSLLDVMEGRR
jgi:plasmid stability protein